MYCKKIGFVNAVSSWCCTMKKSGIVSGNLTFVLQAIYDAIHISVICSSHQYNDSAFT